MTGGGHVTLRLGQHYQCSGGWLYNSFFPQNERKNGREIQITEIFERQGRRADRGRHHQHAQQREMG